MIRFERYGSRWNIAFAKPEWVDLAVPPRTARLPIIAKGYPNRWKRVFNFPFFTWDDDIKDYVGIGRIRAWGTQAADYPLTWPLVYRDGTGVHLAPEGGRKPDAYWEVSAGPLLIIGGKATDITSEILDSEPPFTGLRPDNKTWRCGLGMVNGLVVHIVGVSATLQELQAVGMDLGCDWLLAGDGGGSVGLIDAEEGDLANDDRLLPAALVFIEEADYFPNGIESQKPQDASKTAPPTQDIPPIVQEPPTAPLDEGRPFPDIPWIGDQLPRHPTERYATRDLSEIDLIVIHHSATRTGTPEGFAGHHVNTNGWPGIGYHFVVATTGMVWQTNDLRTVCYHAKDVNRRAVGVCVVGDFRNGRRPTTDQLVVTARLVDRLLDRFPHAKVVGHKHSSPANQDTDCPGTATWNLPEVLQLARLLK